MPRVHIVIPLFNHYPMLHNQLWQLYRKEKENIDTVLLINDCSTDEDVENGLIWWRESKMLPLYYNTNPKNLGFLLSANEGISTITGFDDIDEKDIIILLSSDVLIHSKFISQIKDILYSGHIRRLVGGVLLGGNTGWNVFSSGIPIPYLEGWLLATTVEGWNELGYFDGRFSPNDYEDIDLSMTAKKLGYELVPLNNVGIQHLGGKTIGYGENRLKVTNSNREKLKEKWNL